MNNSRFNDILKGAKKIDHVFTSVARERKGSPGRWSTGNAALDVALGGGLSMGRVHEFFGPPSSGKTTSLYHMIATAQNSCSLCGQRYEPVNFCKCEDGPREAVIMLSLTEDWDPAWAETIGVDLDRLLLTEADDGEVAMDYLNHVMGSGKVDLICIDSIAFLLSKTEIEKSLSENHVAEHAKLVSDAIKKLVTSQRKIKNKTSDEIQPTIVVTNQIRSKVGVIYGSTEKTTGGHALEHSHASRTRFGNSKVHRSGGQTEYVQLKGRVKKNKTAAPGEDFEVKLWMVPFKNKTRGSLQDEDALLTWGKRLDLFVYDPSAREWPVPVLDHTFGKQDEIIETLMDDPELKLKTVHALTELLKT